MIEVNTIAAEGCDARNYDGTLLSNQLVETANVSWLLRKASRSCPAPGTMQASSDGTCVGLGQRDELQATGLEMWQDGLERGIGLRSVATAVVAEKHIARPSGQHRVDDVVGSRA